MDVEVNWEAVFEGPPVRFARFCKSGRRAGSKSDGFLRVFKGSGPNKLIFPWFLLGFVDPSVFRGPPMRFARFDWT